MCGILGKINFNQESIDPKQFASALSLLNKRGPDSQGAYHDSQSSFGQTRLAIIDLSEKGVQPFWDRSHRYLIIFNGEIYNYRELKQELIAKGHTFTSSTDTEVLLYYYLEFGKNCLEKLNGIFSFAIYDSHSKKTIIVRDHFGIKPLVYYQDEKSFIFASEIKAILPFLGLKKEINYQSLYSYLQFSFVPAPESIFKGIKKLQPGHFVEIEGSKVSIGQYYKLKWNPRDYVKESYKDQKINFLQLLENSVKRQLVSDAPLGAFLSGGIDSSAIVALASRHVPNLKTFSIGFKEKTIHDETFYSNLVAKKFNTNHQVIRIDEHDYLHHLQDVLSYLDEPFADSSALAVYILSKTVRKEVTVCLSGDGADEVFAGYNRHQAEYLLTQNKFLKGALNLCAPFTKKLPKSRDDRFGNYARQLHRFAQASKLNSVERYLHWCRFTSSQNAYQSLNKDIQQEIKCDQEYLLLNQMSEGLEKDFKSYLYKDVHFILPDDMLRKVDSMSMANSLEVRIPFLDYELVEYAFKLPASSKIDSQMRKKIIQDSFRNILPDELYQRPKQGFSIPLLKWFQGDLWQQINEDWLSDKNILEQGIFDIAYVRKLKADLKNGKRNDFEAQLWSLIAFQAWYKNYFK